MTAKEQGLPALVAEGLDYFDLAGDEGDLGYVKAIREHIAQLGEIESVLLAYALRPPEVSTADAVRWAMQTMHARTGLSVSHGQAAVPNGFVPIPWRLMQQIDAALMWKLDDRPRPHRDAQARLITLLRVYAKPLIAPATVERDALLALEPRP